MPGILDTESPDSVHSELERLNELWTTPKWMWSANDIEIFFGYTADETTTIEVHNGEWVAKHKEGMNRYIVIKCNCKWSAMLTALEMQEVPF